MANSGGSLFTDLALLFEPFLSAAEGDHFLRMPLAEIGWDADKIVAHLSGAPYQELRGRIAGIVDQIQAIQDQLRNPPEDIQGIMTLLESVQGLLDEIRELPEGLIDGSELSDGGLAWNALGRDLLSLSVSSRVELLYPRLGWICRLLTITVSPNDLPRDRYAEVTASDSTSVVRGEVPWAVLEPLRVLELLNDPVGFLAKTYLNEGNLEIAHGGNRLFPRLRALLGSLGLRSGYSIKSNQAGDFNQTEDDEDIDDRRLAEHSLSIHLTGDEADPKTLTLTLNPLPDGDPLGLVIVPSQVDLSIDDADLGDWTLSVGIDSGGAAPATSFALGPSGPAVLPDGSTPKLEATFSLKEPLLFGDPLRTHLRTEGGKQLSLSARAEVADAVTQSFELGLGIDHGRLNIEDVLTLHWDRLKIGFDSTTKRIGVQPQGLKIWLKDVFAEVDLDAPAIGDFSYSPQSESDPACVSLSVSDFPIHALLKMAGANLDANSGEKADLRIRILFEQDGEPRRFHLREIRIDWSPGSQTLDLPGFRCTATDPEFFSLVFGGKKGGDWKSLSLVSLLASLDPNADAGTQLEFGSTFAWNRENGGRDERELQSDAGGRAPELFKLTMTPQEQERVSLLLVAFDPDRTGFPEILRELNSPLTALGCGGGVASDLDARAPQRGTWTIGFEFTGSDFALPFLNQPGKGQFIRLTRVKACRFENDKLPLVIDAEVALAPGLLLATKFNASLSLDNFALGVTHSKGLILQSEEQVNSGSYLGFQWTFRGEKNADDRYDLFTLSTDEYDYRIVQAEDSTLELSYAGLGRDPVRFGVQGFQVTEAGVSLQAEVLPEPVRLNGIDTRFRFEGTRLEITDSRLAGFTLMGSGPLPPALLGDGTVDLALQFEPAGTGLRLVNGSARVNPDKPLVSPGVSFRFQLDAIDLRIVQEGGYHLYFLISGSAQYSAGSGDDGALSQLADTRIEFENCPISGDLRVVGKHIKRFLIPLRKPVRFPFLGCFTMEVRGFGFYPSSQVFGGDGALRLSGQIYLADRGDAETKDVERHNVYLGLPAPGSIRPRLHLDTLPLDIGEGDAFCLTGFVRMVTSEQRPGQEGFEGEGVLKIQGMETAASFAFMRLRPGDGGPPVRAWFVFLEQRRVSFPLPGVQLFLREVGLGFGYRYTLASLKEADREQNLGKLLKGLREISRSQGSLSRLSAWSPDADRSRANWTIALRGLFSQSSAATTPLDWQESKEKKLSSAYLFDAVVALRSDLTFMMAVRAWLNTNYYSFNKQPEIRDAPPFSGFVLLTPRRKRLLAQMSSNPNGYLGGDPPPPALLKRALQNGRFSVTLLVEPGLVHYELGWPNQLQWKENYGPLKAELRGGYIMRVSREHLVLGNSVEVRAGLDMGERQDLGFVGFEFHVTADVAYGARYMGLIPTNNPRGFGFYAAAGLEASIDLGFKGWIGGCARVKAFGRTYEKCWRRSARLSARVDLTAALELGVLASGLGVRGHGALALPVLGRRVDVSARVDFQKDKVGKAKDITAKVLDLGLEARDVGEIPGVGLSPAAPKAAPDWVEPRRPVLMVLNQPDYIIYAVRRDQDGEDDSIYFLMLPKGEGSKGFLPPPPEPATLPDEDGYTDFRLDDIEMLTGVQLHHWQWRDGEGDWPEVTDTQHDWKANWSEVVIAKDDLRVIDVEDRDRDPDDSQKQLTLADYLLPAFLTRDEGTEEEQHEVAASDPHLPGIDEDDPIRDPRTISSSESDYDAAVRGTLSQFGGSPLLRFDPGNDYDARLAAAFSTDAENDVYRPLSGFVEPENNPHRRAQQMRGSIIEDMVADLLDYANGRRGHEFKSPAFLMGLVFKATREHDRVEWPAWLDEDVANGPSIHQRIKADSDTPDGDERTVRLFNARRFAFDRGGVEFDQPRIAADSATVAFGWELRWGQPPEPEEEEAAFSAAQRNPEHLLQHYEVRRRIIDGPPEQVGREEVSQHRTADVLQRGEFDDRVRLLKSRFSLVDHFADESAEQRARLPLSGITYLYSIVAVDLEGRRSAPLPRTVTRYPDHPPPAPTKAKLEVVYRISGPEHQQDDAVLPPKILSAQEIRVSWQPPEGTDEIPVPQGLGYRLVLRPVDTLPVGSYGQDSATADAGVKSLPAASALPLAGDLMLDLPPGAWNAEKGRQEVVLDPRQAFPGYPGDGGTWEPKAWRIFIQAVSPDRGPLPGIPSALMPVEIRLLVGAPRPELKTGEELLVAECAVPELEWLPRRHLLPIMPMCDGGACTGAAHVPVAKPDAGGRLSYLAHPSGRRGLRFIWNQVPSDAPSYPPELTAGYDLLRLDVDRQTTATLDSGAETAKALTLERRIELVPADDKYLTPADSLTPAQWEAWYPSELSRREQTGTDAWYSWRDSELYWPAWNEDSEEDLEEKPRPLERLHPLLRTLVTELEKDEAEKPRYHLDLQSLPPNQIETMHGFFAATDVSVDAYGWGALQQMGLSMALSLRDGSDQNALVTGHDLRCKVSDTLGALLRDDGYRSLAEHAFVEFLVQPGQALSLEAGGVDDDALLGLIQVSLRPLISRQLHYAGLTLRGAPGVVVKLSVTALNSERTRTRLVSNGDPAALTETAIPAGESQSLDLRLPLTGSLDLYLRGTETDLINSRVEIEVRLEAPLPLRDNCDSDPDCENAKTQFKRWFQVVDGQATGLLGREHPGVIDQAKQRQLLKAFAPAQREQASALLSVQPGQARNSRVPVGFPVRLDPGIPGYAAYFSQPDDLEQRTDDNEAGNKLEEIWSRFRRRVPGAPAKPGDQLGTYLLWANRFFTHAGVPVQPRPSVHWFATAYPVATTTAFAAADQDQRVHYEQITDDPWSHICRFYIQPRGRYERIWERLAEELQLRRFAEPPESPPPDPEAGGIDLVLDRTEPIAAPTLLRIGRLDPPVSAGSTVGSPPGHTLEAILAAHPEQRLDSANQTLRHRLSYLRQAWSLTRRFAEVPWAAKFGSYVTDNRVLTSLEVKPVAPYMPDPMDQWPPEPDDTCPCADSGSLIEAGQEDSSATLELSLPLRLGGFQRPAMVLQWQGLPHYYEHVLHCVAQSSFANSAVNSASCRDFQYRAPVPRAVASTPESDGGRDVYVRVERLYDSLPEISRERWPETKELLRRGNGAVLDAPGLPDPDLIYHLVESYGGNVEVQFQITPNRDTGGFLIQRLGRRFEETGLELVLCGDDRFWLKLELKPAGGRTGGREIRLRILRDSAVPSEALELKPADEDFCVETIAGDEP